MSMLNALFLQRPYRGQRTEGRVTIVGTATAIQFAILDNGHPRVEAVRPAAEFRLFVIVSIEQYNVVGIAWNVDK